MTTKSLLSRTYRHSHQTAQLAISHFLTVSITLNQLKQTHTLFIKTLTKPHQKYCYTQLLKRLVLCFSGENLSYALKVFEEIPKCRNRFLWTSLIRNHVLHAKFSESIALYAKMHWLAISPSGFTFSSVLNACARAPAFVEGSEVHTHVVKLGFLHNKFVITALLDVYAKCGYVYEARRLLDMMGEEDRDVTACTAMINGYSKKGMMYDARMLFDAMKEHNVITWSAMVSGYANCGDMKSAKELYNGMVEKNPVTWVAMIAGYGKCGNVNEAKRVFDDTSERDGSCWAAMVACYAQNGCAKEAIEMYKVMREGNVGISEVAMVAAISACTQIEDDEMAVVLAEHVKQGCCDRTEIVSNALIHMHAKCGHLDDAWREFNTMTNRDVVSYTAMITALANHGNSRESLHLFMKMMNEGIKPNHVTFIGVLSACSHGGLVDDGIEYFQMMTQTFGIKPLSEHLTCVVDLLGRAGKLEKAHGLIMEFNDMVDAGVWGALLGGCKVHDNAKFGEIAARNLFEIEPWDTGNYMVLANIYAAMGNWEDCERVRKMVSERGNKRFPGCSWVSCIA